jgi:N6-adenosine-specific RNA methylase IME4
MSVVILDPPWSWKSYSQATGMKKAPKYRTMSIAEIAALGPTIKAVAGKNALVLMWATAPLLLEAGDVLRQWGVKYSTARVWQKDRIGTGYWVRSDAEFVLMGKYGSPKLPAGAKDRTIFKGSRLEKKHSSKPDDLHTWVERSWPGARKVELFARRARKGWDCYGDELGWLITPQGLMRQGSAPNGAMPQELEKENGETRIAA